MEGLRPWAILSLVGLLAFLGATYDWFDADEFVNLQQALRVQAGHALYVETPSHHPPLYTEIVLRPLASLPIDLLLAARVVNTVLMWATGLMAADLFRRHVGLGAARTFLTFWTLNGFVLVAGTRAMNEAPLTALLMYAAYAMVTGRTLVIPAAAAAASVLVRYTAVFFLLSLVPREPRRLAALVGWGTLALAVLLVPTLALRPGALDGLLAGTVIFHAERSTEAAHLRLGKTLWWSGILFVLPVAKAAGLLPQPHHGLVRMGGLALVGAGMLVLLPAVHVHYFLPCAVVVTAVAVVGVGRLRAAGHQQLIFTSFLLVTASQGGFYVPQTPHDGLDDARRAASWIRDHSTDGERVLTDAPQYAILAGRDNWRGYYWSLRSQIPPADLESALDEVTLVAVSERFGHYDRGFPTAFLATLETLPCQQLPGVRVYHTGSGMGDASDFAGGC